VYENCIHNGEKIHATFSKLNESLRSSPKNIPNKGLTTPALAMPEEYRGEDTVKSYRSYYKSKEILFRGTRSAMKWTGRDRPEWI
jgi:hypothetical protein